MTYDPAVGLVDRLRPLWARLFGSRTLIAVWATLTLVVVAITVSGGFGTASPPETPRVDAGEPVDVGQVELAARAWSIRDDVEPEALAEIDGAAGWLIIDAEVRAVTDATTTFPETALDLPGDLLADPEDEGPARVVLSRDTTVFPDLQPGLTERVLLLWPVTLAAAESDELELGYVSSLLDDSTLDAGQVWRLQGTAATTTLPRDDELGAALVDEQ